MDRVSIASGLLLLALGPPATIAYADGNVMATVRNGQLVLRGDGQDNQLRITTDGAPSGGVTVVLTQGTTVNGTSPAFIDFPDLPRGVRASFGGGEDSFGGSELEAFPGDLVVDMGGDADSVAFTDLFADSVDISLGAGDDLAGFDVLACTRLRFRGGGGSDFVQWGGGSVSDDANIGMGNGDDGLTLTGIGLVGPARITMGGGDDLLDLQSETGFGSSAFLSGGAGGADAFVDDGTTAFALPPTIVHFEQ